MHRSSRQRARLQESRGSRGNPLPPRPSPAAPTPPRARRAQAALARTQTESSILEVLVRFASFDSAVAAVDEIRRMSIAGGEGAAASAGRPLLAVAQPAASPLGLAAGGAGGGGLGRAAALNRTWSRADGQG